MQADNPGAPSAPSSPQALQVRQWKRLVALYRQLPSSPWNPEAQQALRQVFKRLQSHRFQQQLQSTYSAEEQEALQAQIQQDVAAYCTLNQERVQSLLELATPELRTSVQEALTLFHYNLPELPEQLVERTVGYDDDGHPIIDSGSFHLFPEHAPAGLEGRSRFLPSHFEGLEPLATFEQREYPPLVAQPPTDLRIKAITTIGSLGGIGHKPDSDMDAQVIVSTDPEVSAPWNDLDFLLAFLEQVLSQVRTVIFHQVLNDHERERLQSLARKELEKRYAEGLREEERLVLESVLPSSYQHLLDHLLWKAAQALRPGRLHELIANELQASLRRYPDFAPLFAPVVCVLFPFLTKWNPSDFQANCFPFAGTLAHPKVLPVQLARFYRRNTLGSKQSLRLLSEWAEQQGQLLNEIPMAEQDGFLWEHFKQNPQWPSVLKQFLETLSEHLSLAELKDLPSGVAALQRLLPDHPQLPDLLAVAPFRQQVAQRFRTRMAELVEAHRNQAAQGLEAQVEYPLHLKTQQVEAFLEKKHPEVETHFFRNLLRRMRAGEHTPFLVSPEGSLAYSHLLNDFLLNPAVMLGGVPPLPFDLPDDFRTLVAAGVFDESAWQVPDPHNPRERWRLNQLPDWGSVLIPRELFLEHIVPIFLRESEKVSHRNLPKALLNCWWVEMLCLEDRPQLTSLTRLLLHPEQRASAEEELRDPDSVRLLEIEELFPPLVRDPWWIKFTEMLLRSADLSTRKDLIFCFAQHMRLSDVIDAEGHPLFIQPEEPWRRHALSKFYQLFFRDEGFRLELARFAQGRDDTASQWEERLKNLFLQSLRRVETLICHISSEQATAQVSEYLQSCSATPLDHEELHALLDPLMLQVHQRVAIEDRRILSKIRQKEPLTPLERLQARHLHSDFLRVRKVVQEIADHFSDLPLNSGKLEQLITGAKVRVGGDTNENVIFRHHFERNFSRKQFQIPQPIAKSLSIPRPGILIQYAPQEGCWSFFSRLQRRDAGRDHTLLMFQEPLAQGIARCVFSGYVGFGSRNRTAFQKDPSPARDPQAQNPFGPDDVAALALRLKEAFPPMRLRPRELLAQQHYIRELFLAGNVNQHGTWTLLVRDNLSEWFAIDFAMPEPRASRREEVRRSPLAFFEWMNATATRQRFQETLAQLAIPLDADRLQTYEIWLNPRSFELAINPAYRGLYLSAIAAQIWPAQGGHAPWSDPARPRLLDHWRTWGQQGIEAHHKAQEENRRKQQKRIARIRKLNDAYMEKIAAELKERERERMQ